MFLDVSIVFIMEGDIKSNFTRGYAGYCIVFMQEINIEFVLDNIMDKIVKFMQDNNTEVIQENIIKFMQDIIIVIEFIQDIYTEFMQ